MLYPKKKGDTKKQAFKVLILQCNLRHFASHGINNIKVMLLRSVVWLRKIYNCTGVVILILIGRISTAVGT